MWTYIQRNDFAIILKDGREIFRVKPWDAQWVIDRINLGKISHYAAIQLYAI